MLSFITTAAAATIGSALNDAIQYGYALATGNKGRAKMLHDIARATTGEIASVLAPNINAGLQQGESNAEQLRKLRLKASTTLEALREMDDSAVSKAMERVYAISTQTAREQIEKIISGATRGETISAAQQTDLEAAQSTIDRVDLEVGTSLASVDFLPPPTLEDPPENGKVAEEEEVVAEK